MAGAGKSVRRQERATAGTTGPREGARGRGNLNLGASQTLASRRGVQAVSNVAYTGALQVAHALAMPCTGAQSALLSKFQENFCAQQATLFDSHVLSDVDGDPNPSPKPYIQVAHGGQDPLDRQRMEPLSLAIRCVGPYDGTLSEQAASLSIHGTRCPQLVGHQIP
jgi:hypothetical protein